MCDITVGHRLIRVAATVPPTGSSAHRWCSNLASHVHHPCIALNPSSAYRLLDSILACFLLPLVYLLLLCSLLRPDRLFSHVLQPFFALSACFSCLPLISLCPITSVALLLLFFLDVCKSLVRLQTCTLLVSKHGARPVDSLGCSPPPARTGQPFMVSLVLSSQLRACTRECCCGCWVVHGWPSASMHP